ncbi:carbohydrate ABC transporter permease [Lachnoclostridium sp.]|uniref:carbohydrate ABC transporter permease n=1 Tax=Lachnoclostridium sp. TaxID=2028282 RepID=UPI00289E12B6|nr:sugar ABC transporter permease [Lachnoclostridium sp.]
MHEKKIYKGYFTVPAVLMYTILFIVPVVLNIIFSFTDWNAIKITGETATYNGLSNYKKIFQNKELTKVILRTIYYACVTTIFKNIIGFLLALAFNEGLKTKNILRAIFFLPAMLSPLIIGLMFGTIFMKNGFFNQLLQMIGFGNVSVAWLTTKGTALNTAMFVEVWKQVGFNMVIYLAGLQFIDKSYYEAASVDGATKFQEILYITVPRIIPSFIINLLLNLSQGLKAFDIVFVLTGGGPAGATELINTFVFKEFGKGLYGMSAAYGVIVFIITAIFGVIVLQIKDNND